MTKSDAAPRSTTASAAAAAAAAAPVDHAMTDVEPSESSIMNIIFGEHASPKLGPSSSSTAKSPPRTRAATAAAAHHLSPPTSGGSRRGSPRSSISEADRLLEQLDDDATTVAASPSKGRKRKSGERGEGGEAEDEEATGEVLKARTAKFIRVSSPDHQRIPASASAVAEEAEIAAVVQPSQDAYDQEDEAAQREGAESPEFDYAEEMPNIAGRNAEWKAKWTNLIAHFPSAGRLEAAAKDSNAAKELGNNEFKHARFPQALEFYSQAIRVLESATKDADLSPWIQLVESEAKGREGAEEEMKIVQEIGGEGNHGMYALASRHLRQLASIYANRATCHAKARSYFAALSDVNQVIALQSQWFKGYSIKGLLLSQQKQFPEAIRAFEQALTIPKTSAEDRAKLSERLIQMKKQMQRTEKKGSGGGTSVAGSQTSTSQSVASLTSEVAKSTPPTRALQRSQSAAAITTTSVGAQYSRQAQPSQQRPYVGQHGTGSAAEPIELSSSLPMEDIPVHPPSISTPPKSSEEQQQKASDSFDLIMRGDSAPTTATPVVVKPKVEAPTKIVKVEPRPRSPLPLATTTAAATSTTVASSALHAPLGDASNRLSPIPRQHASTSAHSPVYGPRSPNRSPRSPTMVHDLTTSPIKSRPHRSTALPGSGHSARSEHRSPSKSPGRSPAREPTNWFQFPIVTIDGIRDLIGDETFAESLNLYDQRRIEAVKIQASSETATSTASGGGAPKLVGLVLKRDAPQRSRHARHPQSTMESKENSTHTVSIRFDDGTEQRVKEFQCDCRDEYQSHRDRDQDAQTTDAAAAAAGLQSPPPSVLHTKIWTACAHVGAVLLVLKKKQEEQEKGKPLEITPSERAKRSMYVTPSRRKTVADQMKEAALRAELENMSNSSLAELLSRNHQSKTGTKPVLIARIIENSTLGNLPRCRKCKGSLFYAAGAYHCHGAFDSVAKKVLPCDFTADRIERTVWQH